MAGIVRYGGKTGNPNQSMENEFGDFTSGQVIQSQWGDDVNASLDDRISKTDTNDQSIASNISISGTLGVTGLLTASGGISAGSDLNLNGNDITGSSVNISNIELQQLSNIGSATISGTQWGYLGAMNQSVASGSSVNLQLNVTQTSVFAIDNQNTGDTINWTSGDFGGTIPVDNSSTVDKTLIAATPNKYNIKSGTLSIDIPANPSSGGQWSGELRVDTNGTGSFSTIVDTAYGSGTDTITLSDPTARISGINQAIQYRIRLDTPQGESLGIGTIVVTQPTVKTALQISTA